MRCVSDKNPKARKIHGCDLCGGTISTGEVYSSVFNVDGDNNWTFKVHLDCRYIMHELYRFFNDPPEGVTQDHFREYLPFYGKEFVCPNCSNVRIDDNDDNYCIHDYNAGTDCLWRIVERLRKYKIKSYRDEKKPWLEEWREVERGEGL